MNEAANFLRGHGPRTTEQSKTRPLSGRERITGVHGNATTVVESLAGAELARAHVRGQSMTRTVVVEGASVGVRRLRDGSRTVLEDIMGAAAYGDTTSISDDEANLQATIAKQILELLNSRHSLVTPPLVPGEPGHHDEVRKFMVRRLQEKCGTNHDEMRAMLKRWIVEGSKTTEAREALAELPRTAMNVNEKQQVIRNCLIVGRTSRHGYEYLDEALRSAVGLYEGCRCYTGHESRGRSGSFGERIGVFRDARVTELGIAADLHYNPNHPLAGQLVYDAKNNPEVLGFSQHAETIRGHRNGKEVVESIVKVHSVDLVNAPATTSGIFESN